MLRCSDSARYSRVECSLFLLETKRMALARAPSTFQWFSILTTEPESAKSTWLRITSLAFAYTIKPVRVPVNMGNLSGAFVAIMFQKFWYIEMSQLRW
jgi:hypothetical protein